VSRQRVVRQAQPPAALAGIRNEFLTGEFCSVAEQVA
jgi:hypothetical protein